MHAAEEQSGACGVETFEETWEGEEACMGVGGVRE